MTLRLAGEAGQLCLARSADTAGARAAIDQHESAIRELLTGAGGALTTAALMSYAQGFTEAAIARGWQPPHRRERNEWRAPWENDEDNNPLYDWESLRLAAVCRMFIAAQGLAV